MSKIKKEIFDLIDNRANNIIEEYNECVKYSNTPEFQEHKRLYDFGFSKGDKSRKYSHCIHFMEKYSWFIDKYNYYKSKYLNMVFFDEYLDDHYFFERYKQGSESQVRMLETYFSGDISVKDLNIIEKNLLCIDNKDRMVYHKLYTQHHERLCFGDLSKKKQQLVLTDDKDWYFDGVEMISHSSYLFDHKPIRSEYWAVVLCPVDKGYLVLHRF